MTRTDLIELLRDEKSDPKFLEWCRHWDEKHAGECKDQTTKERYDLAEARNNEWGI